jgi:hypothetical protein
MFNRLEYCGGKRSRRFAHLRMSFINIVIGIRKFKLGGQCSSAARSSLIAVVTFIPVLASILSFVRHSSTPHLIGY